jgi:hypothetical protein
MKKILIALVVLILLALGAVFLFIPGEIRVLKSNAYQTNVNGASRLLAETKAWEPWWPAGRLKEQDLQFRVAARGLNTFDIILKTGNDSFNTRLRLIPMNTDSCLFSWEYGFASTSNPLERISRYRKGVRLKNAFDELLNEMGRYMEKPENIYGFAIKKDIVPDSLLISTRRLFNHYPDATETGKLIEQVKDYMKSSHAKVVNNPMMHVQQTGETAFEVMVALPSDKVLPNTSQFETKRLLKNGNLLTAPVKGGPWKIGQALQQMEIYKTDYGRASPAIPYQLMLTDRTLEKDSSKWETLICYPVL